MPKEKRDTIDLNDLLANLKERGVPVQEAEAYLETLISSNALKLPPKDQ